MCTSIHILYILYSKQQINTIILKEFFFHIYINKCAYYISIKALKLTKCHVNKRK